MLALLGMLGAGGLVLVTGRGVHLRSDTVNPPLRVALWSLACGLVGYLIYSLGLPGSHVLEGVEPGLRGLIIGFGFGLLPIIVLIWLYFRGSKGEES